MQVQLHTVGDLLEQIDRVDVAEFVAEFPGIFLMAMGMLSGEMSRGRRAGDTLSMAFGAHLRHDPRQEHPLAGCAFFLRATDERSEFTVGRSAQCTITIPDASVSELHCCIAITDEGVAAIDLNSRNGTSVNMQRLPAGDQMLLGDEDILTIGRYSFQVLTAATFYDALALLRNLDEQPEP